MKQEALKYHESGRRGKIEVIATNPAKLRKTSLWHTLRE